MKHTSNDGRPLSPPIVLLFLAALSFGPWVSEAKAQQTATSEASIQQVASFEESEQTATDLWEQLSCTGLGETGAECVLSASVPSVPPGANLAKIVQRGSSHGAEIIQHGTGNVAVSTQHGSGNELSATQLGNDNLIGIRVVGHDNSLDVLQDGNDNAYLFSFEGDDLDHSVSQIGDDLRLIQLGSGSLPFSVEQRGSDMTIRIEHNPLSPWPH